MKFSIIIPAYKKRYLAEAIDSVLKQSYQDFELIIVDDCSPEDLKSVIDKFSDNRILYYKNEYNFGAQKLVDNWNHCLNFCNGEYIINMGDDDRLLPCCLEEYVKLICKYPTLNVYHAKTQIIDENGEIFDFQAPRPEIESSFSMIYRQWNYDKHQYIGDFCFSKKWLLENDGYVSFPFALCSDWATANSAAYPRGIANGNIPMFQYRKNRFSISVTQNIRTAADTLSKIYEFYRMFLSKETFSEEDEILKKILNNQCYSYYSNVYRMFLKSDIKNNSDFFSSLIYWSKDNSIFHLNKKQILKTILKK